MEGLDHFVFNDVTQSSAAMEQYRSIVKVYHLCYNTLRLRILVHTQDALGLPGTRGVLQAHKQAVLVEAFMNLLILIQVLQVFNKFNISAHCHDEQACVDIVDHIVDHIWEQRLPGSVFIIYRPRLIELFWLLILVCFCPLVEPGTRDCVFLVQQKQGL